LGDLAAAPRRFHQLPQDPSTLKGDRATLVGDLPGDLSDSREER
jgi:hypothetical protein